MESDLNSSGIQWYTIVYNPFPIDAFIQICSERITPLSPLSADPTSVSSKQCSSQAQNLIVFSQILVYGSERGLE